jgi:hypothetical protein
MYLKMIKIVGYTKTLVAYNYNPSYSGCKYQEDKGQSQPGQLVYKTLSQKHPSRKKGWWSDSRYRP